MGTFVWWKLWLDPEPLGCRDARCPHCRRDCEHRLVRLRGSLFSVLPLPSRRAAVCGHCRQVSQLASRASRLGMTVALSAPLLLASGGVYTGALLVRAGSLATGAAIALLSAGLIWTLCSAIRGLLRRPAELVPLAGLLTDLSPPASHTS